MKRRVLKGGCGIGSSVSHCTWVFSIIMFVGTKSMHTVIGVLAGTSLASGIRGTSKQIFTKMFMCPVKVIFDLNMPIW